MKDAAELLTAEQVKAGFAERIKLLRRALGFRFLRQFAKRVGIRENTMQKYEQGSRVPSLKGVELQLIRRATGATVDWLVYGDEDSLPVPLRLKIIDQRRKDGYSRKTGGREAVLPKFTGED